MSTMQKFNELSAKTDYQNDDELFAFFGSLPAVSAQEMLGKWQGGDFKTGHWAGQALIDTRWFGKWFKGKFDVAPLVSYNDEGKLYSNKMMGGQEASLQMVEFRGVVSATMIYDGAPIFDHFRKVDDNTVMGVMDGKPFKGFPDIVSNGRYYFFFLKRIDEFPVEFVEA
ncbi:DUF4334 domain-containing protein [Neisseria perflava]|uniref:DUF4334 domain-containing protein n=1 Tax=Neisseria perflava TaxID=33053 RepID=UPI0020A11337|nr:DUF4334 domain-containing protein [Neisseria perflava]MCP1660687.1 hypothetical protein [Neisseria perflava]MCP1771865.1 hypothetical protein [Neisseria perflava]